MRENWGRVHIKKGDGSIFATVEQLASVKEEKTGALPIFLSRKLCKHYEGSEEIKSIEIF